MWSRRTTTPDAGAPRRHDGLAPSPASPARGRRGGGGVGARVGAGRLRGRARARPDHGLARSAEGAGAAVERTGRSIRDVDLPVVGTVLRDTGDEGIAAGRDAQAQARDSGDSVHKAAILLALAVWLVPTLPLLLLYAPVRVLRGRD